jgi:hypothetical protein
MNGGGFTLGHFLTAVSAVELVFGLVLVFRAMNAAPDMPPDRRRGLSYVAGAVLLSAVALFLVARFLPEARLRLF